MTTTLVSIIIGVVILIALIALWYWRYTKAGPNEVLVVAGLGRYRPHGHVGMNLVDVFSGQFGVEGQIGQQVGFVEQSHVALAEHEGVFEGLVLAFGDAQDHGAGVFADVELRRADQITDIFDDE